jgi:CO dehydrogenase nickel-insertion accessory protein CooC1
MNEDKLFVIGIGGTGMRCLESFVHMCAMGMFDNKEINILTLDTDQENGNLKRVWDLIDLYNRIKNPTGNISDVGGKPSANTFFSAKLNLSKFWPAYSGGVNYQSLSNISIQNDQTKDNIDLAS